MPQKLYKTESRNFKVSKVAKQKLKKKKTQRVNEPAKKVTNEKKHGHDRATGTIKACEVCSGNHKTLDCPTPAAKFLLPQLNFTQKRLLN